MVLSHEAGKSSPPALICPFVFPSDSFKPQSRENQHQPLHTITCMTDYIIMYSASCMSDCQIFPRKHTPKLLQAAPSNMEIVRISGNKTSSELLLTRLLSETTAGVLSHLQKTNCLQNHAGEAKRQRERDETKYLESICEMSSDHHCT